MAEVHASAAGSYEIVGVSKDAFERARAFFSGGVSGLDGDSGTAVGNSARVDYEYEPAAQVVRIKVQSYPEHLASLPESVASGALMETLRNAFDEQLAASMEALAGRRPDKYGVYDYVVPNLTNNTSIDLQFSSQSMSHGTLASNASTIKAGQTAELFEADSAKLSGLGVGGTVTFQLTDGTPLAVDFYLNTKYTYSFSAGFSGGNAGRYAPPTITDKSPVLEGYTYLTPSITIANR